MPDWTRSWVILLAVVVAVLVGIDLELYFLPPNPYRQSDPIDQTVLTDRQKAHLKDMHNASIEERDRRTETVKAELRHFVSLVEDWNEEFAQMPGNDRDKAVSIMGKLGAFGVDGLDIDDREFIDTFPALRAMVHYAEAMERNDQAALQSRLRPPFSN